MQVSDSRTLRIGSLHLQTPILLAPMAGYTDLPFRSIVRPLGGLGLAFAEMMNPPSILFGKGKRRTELLATTPEDTPLGHQIYGTDADLMARAAQWLEEQGTDLVDINMGCPQREITAGNAGAALLKQPKEAVRIAEQVVRAVSVPVTAKIRLGWDAESIVAADLARQLEGVGIAAITVHGRTRQQGYGGRADLDEIRKVVEAVEGIPVIGNGDITSPLAARRMLEETGCAGVMVARGATKDPWLIRNIWRELSRLSALPAPSQAEKVAILREQFERSILHYGQLHAVAIFRRWIPPRASSLGLSREKMLQILKIRELPEMRAALEQLQNEAAAL
ncbi:MAG TPA: tRNA dihydrouridine synthase DusB [Chloroflexota bacterium]|nr:tRNA dihydrouridine synthase DusB [Chloroflexota bacterium]